MRWLDKKSKSKYIQDAFFMYGPIIQDYKDGHGKNKACNIQNIKNLGINTQMNIWMESARKTISKSK